MHATSRTMLMQIIDFARGEIADLGRYSKLEYKQYSEDKDVRRLVDRMIENITNALIDIAKIVISDNNLEIPDSYAGIMEKIGGIFNFNDEEKTSLIQIPKLRNILAHEYLDIKWKNIKNFIDIYQLTAKLLIEKTGNLLQ